MRRRCRRKWRRHMFSQTFHSYRCQVKSPSPSFIRDSHPSAIFPHSRFLGSSQGNAGVSPAPASPLWSRCNVMRFHIYQHVVPRQENPHSHIWKHIKGDRSMFPWKLELQNNTSSASVRCNRPSQDAIWTVLLLTVVALSPRSEGALLLLCFGNSV